MYFCIAFCIAVILCRYQTTLLPFFVIAGLCFFASVLFVIQFQYRSSRTILLCIIGFCLGVAYLNWFAAERLSQQLPEAYEQKDIEVDAIISSLPVSRDRYQQYKVDVISAPLLYSDSEVRLHKLLLSDYQPKAVHPCDRWKFTVRLKRPHGLGNPSGFDYEAYLLEQGIQGKGYVRSAKLISSGSSFCLHGIRQDWSDYVLSRVESETAAWIVALSTGDNSLMNDEQSQLLLETGTMHLFVISGSHIALCALAIYAFVMLLRRAGLGILFGGDWRPLAAFAALTVAACYTALAGYGVPSVRSLIMLLVFLGAQIAGLQLSLWLRFWFSMLMVLMVNPLSALNVGFVLSFGAVFILILLKESPQKRVANKGIFQRLAVHVNELFLAQWMIFIGLLPFTLMYFSQVSLLAPLVNFFAVPAMSFIILPTILLALFLWCVTGQDYYLLKFADYQLDGLFQLINLTNSYLKGQFITFPTVAINDSMIVILLMGCFLLLLPKVFRLWPVGLIMVVAVFLANPEAELPDGSVSLDVIDVDQGLAILVKTANHQMLVDTGAGWPGGSMVNRAVKPYLLSQGISSLDRLLISHLDNDHAGGIEDLLHGFNVAEVLSSESIRNVKSLPCKKNQSWKWDGVTFRILHPGNAADYNKRNNRSCVLLIEAGGRFLLLPGDIEETIEGELVSQLPAIDVMIAPHHGSKTSSTESWVQKAENGIVVFSSGYLSQFRHPHPLVEDRYHAVRAKSFNTALQGLIHLQVNVKGKISVYSWRERKGKYWHKISRTNNHT